MIKCLLFFYAQNKRSDRLDLQAYTQYLAICRILDGDTLTFDSACDKILNGYVD